MPVYLAYIGVIMIWSTTPLAIKWSSTSMTPVSALTARMLAAWLIVAVMACLLRQAPLDIRTNWKSYSAASMAVFPGLWLAYEAVRYVPSGLVAVFMATAAFFTAIFASLILGEKTMTGLRLLALAVAMSGVLLISSEQLAFGEGGIKGILLLLGSVLSYSLSSVLIKCYGADIGGRRQMRGALLFSLPGLLLAWLLLDGQLPPAVATKSLLSGLYLVVIGTVVGFSLFFYLLQRIPVVTLGLLPMMTPALAVWIGSLLNNEPVSGQLLWGTGLIVSGLGLFNQPGLKA